MSSGIGKNNQNHVHPVNVNSSILMPPFKRIPIIQKFPIIGYLFSNNCDILNLTA